MNGFEYVAKLAQNSHPADSVEEACAGKDAILEPKYDGIRLLIHVRENDVLMYARSGKSKSGKLPTIDAELLAALPADTWLDAEAVAFNADGTQDWGGAQSVLGSGVTRAALLSDKIRLVIFDLLAHGGIDARSLPLRSRRELLETIFADASFDKVQLSPWMPATAESHEANLEAGFEGSIVKHLDAAYASGKRVRTSVKLKATDTVDAVITGFKLAEADSWIAKAGMIGAIEFVHYQDGVAIKGRCSGMTTAERRAITDAGSDLVGAVIEVSYMTRMPSGTLRHPQFKRIRTDKTVAECRA